MKAWKIGRICFASAMAAFGFMYLLYGRFVGGCHRRRLGLPAHRLYFTLLGGVLIAA